MKVVGAKIRNCKLWASPIFFFSRAHFFHVGTFILAPTLPTGRPHFFLRLVTCDVSTLPTTYLPPHPTLYLKKNKKCLQI